MQADPLFFFRQRTPQEIKSGGFGVNKLNRGYPADFEFIERPLKVFSIFVIFYDKIRNLRKQFLSPSKRDGGA